MSWSEEDENKEFVVVIDKEEMYSIWPADRELPLGWKEEGFKGTKRKCINYIEEVWTDLRPLSLRKMMEEQEKKEREKNN